MTTDEESQRSQAWARSFLLALINPKETPRVPRYLREEASDILRHYPYTCELGGTKTLRLLRRNGK